MTAGSHPPTLRVSPYAGSQFFWHVVPLTDTQT